MRGWIREDEDDHDQQMTVNLLVAILCLLLLGAGLYLTEAVHRSGKIQDCFEAGRRICPTADPPPMHRRLPL